MPLRMPLSVWLGAPRAPAQAPSSLSLAGTPTRRPCRSSPPAPYSTGAKPLSSPAEQRTDAGQDLRFRNGAKVSAVEAARFVRGNDPQCSRPDLIGSGTPQTERAAGGV